MKSPFPSSHGPCDGPEFHLEVGLEPCPPLLAFGVLAGGNSLGGFSGGLGPSPAPWLTIAFCDSFCSPTDIIRKSDPVELVDLFPEVAVASVKAAEDIPEIAKRTRFGAGMLLESRDGLIDHLDLTKRRS